MYLIGNHDFSFYLEHGYAHLGETNCYFADGSSRILVPGLTHLAR
jgi:hypothetical protein